MKRFLFVLLTVSCLALIGCGAGVNPDQEDAPAIQASPARASERIAVTTVTASPIPSSTPDVYSALYPSQTALALFEQQLAQEEQALQLKLISDSATSTAVAAVTQGAILNAQSTEVKSTQVAGTQTAYPLTQTPIAATQQIAYVAMRTSQAVTVCVPLVSFLIVIAGAYLAFDFVQKKNKSKYFQERQIPVNDKGQFNAIGSGALDKNEKIVNPNLSHRASLDPNSDDLTAEQALANTANLRETNVMQTFATSPLFGRSIARNLLKPQSGVTITKPDGERLLSLGAGSNALPALPFPPIKLLFNWDGGLLPFGVDEQAQLMRVDPAKRPHFMITGATGSGKTRSGIRTLASCALASGWNVFAIGKGVDFFPFEDELNFRILPVNLMQNSQLLIDVLNRLTDLMYKRDEILVKKRVSTWDRYGAPQTVIIFDDYTGQMLAVPKPQRSPLLEKLLMIAMDGRKYGLNLMLGIQRPSWSTISTDLRSQFARIAYRVELPRESRIAIEAEGAEQLPERHFLTRITDDSNIQRGVGFSLQDEEIVAFLKSRPVEQNEPMDWIDGVVTEEAVEDQRSAVSSQPSEVSGQSSAIYGEAYANASDEVKIRQVYLEAINQRNIKLSLRMIEKAVFGYTGGKATTTTLAELARFEGCKPDEVAGVIQAKVAEWKVLSATTEAATTSEKSDLTPDSLVVAG